MPTITVATEKNHFTDKMTNLRIEIDMAGVNPNQVTRLQLISTFKYKLRDILNLDMVGMLHAIVETPEGAGQINLIGDLTFAQEEPILIDNVRRVLFDSDPILSDYSTLGLNQIVENY